MKYDYLIFDFDGTLVDTAPVILETMQTTIKRLGLPTKSDAECRAMIGYRLVEIPSILWPDLPDISDKYVKTYREVFNAIKDKFKANLYPNIDRTLRELHIAGVEMAIASSRSKISLEEYAEKLGIASLFKQLVGGEDVKNGKPAPDPVNTILAKQKWDKGKTLVVGDMNVDILMGNSAGTSTCGVTYGNGSFDDLRQAGATYIISDFSQLSEIVL